MYNNRIEIILEQLLLNDIYAKMQTNDNIPQKVISSSAMFNSDKLND